MNKDQRPLTQSMIKTFNWCEMKYYYEYVMRIIPKLINFPYVVGAAFHEGTLSFMKWKDEERSLQLLLNYLDNKKNEFSLEHAMSAEQDQEFYYQSINAKSMFENFIVFYNKFIYETKVLCMERVFESSKIKLPGKFVLMGKLDAIIKHKKNRYTYELKTSKTPSYDAIMGYYAQIITYYILASEKYKLDGCMISAIKKPQLKMKEKESEEEFTTRLEDNYEHAGNYFDETVIPQKNQIKQHTDFIKDTADRIIKAEKKKQFQMNRFMCRVYGVCPYLILCDAGRTKINLAKYKKKYSVNPELKV